MNPKDRYAKDPIYRAVTKGLSNKPIKEAEGPDDVTDAAATRLIDSLVNEGLRILPSRGGQPRYRLPDHPEVTVGQVWIDSHTGMAMSVIARDTRSATIAPTEEPSFVHRRRVPLARLTSQYALKDG